MSSRRGVFNHIWVNRLGLLLGLTVLAIWLGGFSKRVLASISPAKMEFVSKSDSPTEIAKVKLGIKKVEKKNRSKHWVGKVKIPSANSSYLSTVQLQQVEKFQMIDPTFAKGMEQSYDDRFRDYEMRKNYGNLSPEDEMSHLNSLTDLRRDVFSQIRTYHLLQTREKADIAFKNNDNLRLAAAPLAVAAVAMGNPLSFQIAQKSKVSASATVPAKAGRVNLDTPAGAGEVSVHAGGGPGGGMTNMFVPDRGFIDPSQYRDTYRVSVSRDLGFLDVRSGVIYGGTTSTITARLERTLLPNLNCAVDSVHPLVPDRADIKEPQENLKLNYEVHF